MRKQVGAPPASSTDSLSKAYGDTNYSRFSVDGVFAQALDISSVPASYSLSLAADLTTTSTTIVDATGLLTAVPVGLYVIDAYLIFQSSVTTGGPRFGLGGTCTATATNFSVEQATSTTARTTTIGTAINTTYGATPATASTSFGCNIHGRFQVTAAGTLGLRWLMSIAGTGTLKAGSYLTISRAS